MSERLDYVHQFHLPRVVLLELLANAFDEGCDQFWDHSTGMKKGPPQSGEEYAARIIADLTKEPKP